MPTGRLVRSQPFQPMPTWMMFHRIWKSRLTQHHFNNVASPSSTDLRSGEAVWSFRPSEEASLRRAGLGRWVGAVGVSGDWLVTGGGPALGLYHIPTRKLMKVNNLVPHSFYNLLAFLCHQSVNISRFKMVILTPSV